MFIKTLAEDSVIQMKWITFYFQMAEAGFYSSGKKSEADLAMCYICGKELDGWEEEDDPW